MTGSPPGGPAKRPAPAIRHWLAAFAIVGCLFVIGPLAVAVIRS